MNILITGATGNVGKEIISSLNKIKTNHNLIAAVSNVSRATSKLPDHKKMIVRKLDFGDLSTFEAALDEVDIVFLLRPPQFADVAKYFEPFFNAMKRKSVNQIVFLSVQGVENQSNIPHYKMERAILRYGFEYVFLRPSYFMQNLISTLLCEIKNENRIFIPAGKLKMNWVDVQDIGLVGSYILNDFGSYKNREIEITGSDFVGFKEVAEMLSREIGRQIIYTSPNLLKFILHKHKQGIKPAMIFVMIMLHYLPRFSKNENKLVDTVLTITNKQPNRLRDFVQRERMTLI